MVSVQTLKAIDTVYLVDIEMNRTENAVNKCELESASARVAFGQLVREELYTLQCFPMIHIEYTQKRLFAEIETLRVVPVFAISRK